MVTLVEIWKKGLTVANRFLDLAHETANEQVLDKQLAVEISQRNLNEKITENEVKIEGSEE